MIAFAITACSRGDSLKWTEEVLLPDGRTVTLKRYQEFKGNHEIGDTASVSNYWFEFMHPNTGEKVRWENDRTHTTAFLFMHEKVAHLLVKLNFGGYEKFDCPDPSFLLYAYREGYWRRSPLEAIPIKKFRPNMTSHPKQNRDVIVNRSLHLSAAESGADRVYGTEVWRINFEALKQQTFGKQNCTLQKGVGIVDGTQEK
jgi:hypothetical protein